MARRMPPKLYKQRDKQLIERDGDVCSLCVFEAGGRDTGPIIDVTLDHLDNRKTNHSLRNLTRMCRAHNTAERNRHEAGNPRILTPANASAFLDKAAETIASRKQVKGFSRPSRLLGTGVKEKEGEGEKLVVGLIARGVRERPELDRDEESSGVLQELMPHVYRLWVFEQVKAEGKITIADAIHAGSERVVDVTGKGSEQTIGRYWKQITSRAGWLVETRDDRNRIVWKFREGRDLTELEAKLKGRVNVLMDSLGRPL